MILNSTWSARRDVPVAVGGRATIVVYSLWLHASLSLYDKYEDDDDKGGYTTSLPTTAPASPYDWRPY